MTEGRCVGIDPSIGFSGSFSAVLAGVILFSPMFATICWICCGLGLSGLVHWSPPGLEILAAFIYVNVEENNTFQIFVL